MAVIAKVFQIDPVCGAKVDFETTVWKSDYRGTENFFCSASCKEKFDQMPEAFGFTRAIDSDFDED